MPSNGTNEAKTRRLKVGFEPFTLCCIIRYYREGRLKMWSDVVEPRGPCDSVRYLRLPSIDFRFPMARDFRIVIGFSPVR